VLDLFRYRKKYKHYIDRYYNPNLSLDNTKFEFSSSTILTHKTIRPIKTVMCSYNLNWEGSSYFELQLTLGLKKKGVIDPHVYCFQDGPLRKEYEKEGVSVTIFPSPVSKGFNIESYKTGLETFKNFISTTKAEIVHANTLQMFYGIDAAKSLNIPSLWNVHESENPLVYHQHFGRDIQGKALSCFYYPYKVVFVAKSTKEGCKPLDACHNFQVIYNGKDNSRFNTTSHRDEVRKELGAEKDTVVFLTVGTVCDRKNQLDAILASINIPSVYKDKYKIVIVGDRDSSYSTTLHHIIDSLPKEKKDNIHIIKECPEVERYYQASDCFILTSKMESYPLVILEAIYFGLPIIATPVNGVTEQVYQGINGKFYSPGNTHGLTIEMVNMINFPELRKFLSHNTKIIEEGMLTDQDMICKYEKIFQEAWYSGESR
jgi:glycosyltransferase involved in cell wall biosynthesis